MTASRVYIKRAVLDVTMSPAQQDQGYEDLLKGALLEELSRFIELETERQCPSNESISIDSLNIDLGALNTREEFIEKFKSGFSSALSRSLASAPRKNNELELIKEFLSKGVYPWWAPHDSSHDLGQMISALSPASYRELTSYLLQTIQQPHVRTRLIHQLTPAALDRIITDLLGSQGDTLMPALDILQTVYPAPVRLFLLEEIAGTKGQVSIDTVLKKLITMIASSTATSMPLLVKRLTEELGANTRITPAAARDIEKIIAPASSQWEKETEALYEDERIERKSGLAFTLLSHFITYGSLPTGYHNEDPENFIALIEAIAKKDHPGLMIQLRPALHDPKLLARMFRQLPAEHALRLFQAVFPKGSDKISIANSLLDELFSSRLLKHAATAHRNILGLSIATLQHASAGTGRITGLLSPYINDKALPATGYYEKPAFTSLPAAVKEAVLSIAKEISLRKAGASLKEQDDQVNDKEERDQENKKETGSIASENVTPGKQEHDPELEAMLGSRYLSDLLKHYLLLHNLPWWSKALRSRPSLIARHLHAASTDEEFFSAALRLFSQRYPLDFAGFVKEIAVDKTLRNTVTWLLPADDMELIINRVFPEKRYSVIGLIRSLLLIAGEKKNIDVSAGVASRDIARMLLEAAAGSQHADTEAVVRAAAAFISAKMGLEEGELALLASQHYNRISNTSPVLLQSKDELVQWLSIPRAVIEGLNNSNKTTTGSAVQQVRITPGEAASLFINILNNRSAVSLPLGRQELEEAVLAAIAGSRQLEQQVFEAIKGAGPMARWMAGTFSTRFGKKLLERLTGNDTTALLLGENISVLLQTAKQVNENNLTHRDIVHLTIRVLLLNGNTFTPARFINTFTRELANQLSTTVGRLRAGIVSALVLSNTSQAGKATIPAETLSILGDHFKIRPLTAISEAGNKQQVVEASGIPGLLAERGSQIADAFVQALELSNDEKEKLEEEIKPVISREQNILIEQLANQETGITTEILLAEIDRWTKKIASIIESIARRKYSHPSSEKITPNEQALSDPEQGKKNATKETSYPVTELSKYPAEKPGATISPEADPIIPATQSTSDKKLKEQEKIQEHEENIPNRKREETILSPGDHEDINTKENVQEQSEEVPADAKDVRNSLYTDPVFFTNTLLYFLSWNELPWWSPYRSIEELGRYATQVIPAHPALVTKHLQNILSQETIRNDIADLLSAQLHETPPIFTLQERTGYLIRLVKLLMKKNESYELLASHFKTSEDLVYLLEEHLDEQAAAGIVASLLNELAKNFSKQELEDILLQLIPNAEWEELLSLAEVKVPEPESGDETQQKPLSEKNKNGDEIPVSELQTGERRDQITGSISLENHKDDPSPEDISNSIESTLEPNVHEQVIDVDEMLPGINTEISREETGDKNEHLLNEQDDNIPVSNTEKEKIAEPPGQKESAEEFPAVKKDEQNIQQVEITGIESTEINTGTSSQENTSSLEAVITQDDISLSKDVIKKVLSVSRKVPGRNAFPISRDEFAQAIKAALKTKDEASIEGQHSERPTGDHAVNEAVTNPIDKKDTGTQQHNKEVTGELIAAHEEIATLFDKGQDHILFSAAPQLMQLAATGSNESVVPAFIHGLFTYAALKEGKSLRAFINPLLRKPGAESSPLFKSLLDLRASLSIEAQQPAHVPHRLAAELQWLMESTAPPAQISIQGSKINTWIRMLASAASDEKERHVLLIALAIDQTAAQLKITHEESVAKFSQLLNKARQDNEQPLVTAHYFEAAANRLRSFETGSRNIYSSAITELKRQKKEAPLHAGKDITRQLASKLAQALVNDKKLLSSLKEQVTRKETGTGKKAEQVQDTWLQPEEKIKSGEPIYVFNSGLVLFWPFLGGLFRRLGYLEGQQFIDKEKQEQAVHLLQYIVDESEQSPEHLLPLNKLMCGMDPGMPLERWVKLTEEEKKEADIFITSVKSRWEKMNNTSVATFRRTFIQREGVLTRKDERWQLEVQRTALDVLLARLPWGFSTVKFPWSEGIIFVKWKI